MYKSYDELMSLKTFEDRFEYLMIGGAIGERTFGGNRYLNQRLYSSREWRDLRRDILLRDDGCDLGIPDRQLRSYIVIHHINPITEDDLAHNRASVWSPENLICCSSTTHKAIHYGDMGFISNSIPVDRKPNDTCPWKGGTL